MKIARLISIIMVLLEHRKVSATKLAEMFEVTPRTIYRDIETINLAGIPIISYPGVNGGISIMEEYKIEKKIFTISDITELLIGLGSVHSLLPSEEIINIIAKVKGLVPAEQIKDIESKSDQVAIDHSPWFENKTTKLYVQKIKIAIRENKFISFNYFDRVGNKSQRKIEPYKLFFKNLNWFIHGYCTTKKDFRVFRLSHMSSLEVLNEKFFLREFDYESLNEPFGTDREIIRIKVLIDESIKDLMIEFCGKDNVEPFKNNKFIAYLPFVEDDYWYSIILHFGDKCECLEPENIRLEVIRRLEDTLAIYKK
ncbi:hypothetical protein CDLVIII_1057 [Clostridium sp. DL-VIII]|uniref:helix-turn-helix transcriptional regulator n=1 Tax=Clostridium sp. DL-VIII TaxID=641107 RepID=UPI00023AF3DD|nr:YafY family protein [Clostridium sp. DL-VIII]EHI97760.1 hypothetical protein CDLVIII_1057 [Clostridium sp. DL-VIII]